MTNLTNLGALGAPTTASPGGVAGNEELVSSTQFLELLVAQLQNQNPFEPLEGTEFVTQLAQFASLEQLTGVNQGLDTVSQGQAAALQQQTVEMLGREVTYVGDEVVLSENGPVDLNYRLNSAAPDLTITVYDGFGLPRGTISSAPRDAGLNVLAWDGTVTTPDGQTVVLEPGAYRFEVDAASGDEPIPVQTFGSGRVTGVTWENGLAELMLGDKRIRPGDVLKIAD